jgi:hypothetical protein
VQLPLAAATISLLHFALKHRRWTWWAALGAVAALNVLTKYSAVLLLSCLGAYLIIAGHLHQREIRRGLAVAAMVFALALAPHVSEVLRSDGRSFAYAAEMVSIGSLGPGGRLETIWNFFWAQVARLAPALIAFAIVLRSARRQGAILPRAPALTVEQQWFLWLVGWGPLALTLLFPIVSGARLFTGWGTTFFVLFALWLVTRERLSFNPTQTLLRRTLIIVVALEILLAAVVAWGGGKFPNPLKRLPVAQLPPSDLALHTRAMWSRHSDAPPCVIATDVVTGAMLITRMRGQVPILDHNHSLRHWMREHGCEAKAAVMLLDRPPNEAGLQTLPVAVRDDIRTADTIETFQVQGRGQIVTYYVAILSPQLSKAAREIQ